MDYVVSAVMQKNPLCVPPTMTVAELESFFVRHNVSGFAVVDDDKLVGVVSRTDVIRALNPEYDITRIAFSAEEISPDKLANPKIPDTLGDRAHALQVKDIMTPEVVKVGPNDGLHEVADLMYAKRIHRVFVLDGERLLGIVTPFDFVRLYSKDRIGVEGRPTRTPDF